MCKSISDESDIISTGCVPWSEFRVDEHVSYCPIEWIVIAKCVIMDLVGLRRNRLSLMGS